MDMMAWIGLVATLVGTAATVIPMLKPRGKRIGYELISTARLFNPVIGDDGKESFPFEVSIDGKAVGDLHAVVFRIRNNGADKFDEKKPIIFAFEEPVLSATVDPASSTTSRLRPTISAKAGKIEFAPEFFQSGKEVRVSAFTGLAPGKLSATVDESSDWKVAELRTGLTPLGTAIKWTWNALIVAAVLAFAFYVLRQFYEAGWVGIVVIVGGVLGLGIVLRVLIFLTDWKQWPDHLR